MKHFFHKNKDILFFQIMNWSLNLIIFTFFLKNVDNFLTIVQAEILFGSLGAFLVIYGKQNHTLNFEYKLFTIRIIISMIVLLFILFFPSYYIYGLAAITVLSIPNHLPIIYQFKKKVIYFLTIVKCIPFLILSTHNPMIQVIMYFTPGFLYGWYLYYVYLFTNKEKINNPFIEKKTLGNSISHFLSLIGIYYLQSIFVGYVMTLSDIWVILERLGRSGISFLQPYIVRYLHYFNLKKITYFYYIVFCYIIGISYLNVFTLYTIIFIPLLLDLLLLFSGYSKKSNLIYLLFSFCVVMIIKMDIFLKFFFQIIP